MQIRCIIPKTLCVVYIAITSPYKTSQYVKYLLIYVKQLKKYIYTNIYFTRVNFYC